MSDTIHIGWGDSLCGNYKIGEGDGSSTIFPSEATCEECIRLNKLEQKPIQSREQIIAKQAEEIERLKAENKTRAKLSLITATPLEKWLTDFDNVKESLLKYEEYKSSKLLGAIRQQFEGLYNNINKIIGKENG